MLKQALLALSLILGFQAMAYEVPAKIVGKYLFYDTDKNVLIITAERSVTLKRTSNTCYGIADITGDELLSVDFKCETGDKFRMNVEFGKARVLESSITTNLELQVPIYYGNNSENAYVTYMRKF